MLSPTQPVIEHLRLVESVVDRMGRNSFAIKAIASGLFAALTSVVVTQNAPWVGVGTLSLISLWTLDAYYISRERAFRNFYQLIVDGRAGERLSFKAMSLNYKHAGIVRTRLIAVIVTPSLIMFYLPMIVTSATVSVVIWYTN